MPPLEINQIRHICAFVQHEPTAAQVDQYAAFIHASADVVVDKALNYVLSKDRDFQDSSRRHRPNKRRPLCVCVKGRDGGGACQQQADGRALGEWVRECDFEGGSLSSTGVGADPLMTETVAS